MRNKSKIPETNSICEHFHRTIQGEFNAIAIRNIEKLRLNLNIRLFTTLRKGAYRKAL